MSRRKRQPQGFSWRLLFVTVASGVVAVAINCGQPEPDYSPACVGKCDTDQANAPVNQYAEVGGKWAVDLDKADEKYGGNTKHFLGVSMAELGMEAIGPGLAKVEQMATTAYQADGGNGELKYNIVWDQVIGVRPGYPTIVLRDPSHVDGGLGPYNDQGYRIVAKRGRKYYAVAGKMRIIPMLENTAPEQQKYIKDAMRDGDVIVYVHPEDDDQKGLMERRASHVAMHYEWRTEENELVKVHHIDNPNGYGPMYNHKPDRHMPFQVVRFREGAYIGPEDGSGVTLEKESGMAEAYAFAARTFAVIDNDLSPFDNFFSLRLQQRNDLEGFISALTEQREIPKLYCSGLANANCNQGVNEPKFLRSPEFLNQSWEFSDLDDEFKGADLVSSKILKNAGVKPEVFEALKSANSLVYAPYKASDILNHWIRVTFRGLPETIPFKDPKSGGPVTNKVVKQNVPAEMGQVIDAMGEPDEPFRLRDTVVAMVISSDGFADQIVGAFGQLEWGDEAGSAVGAGDNRVQSRQLPVATRKNAEAWKKAWLMTATLFGKKQNIQAAIDAEVISQQEADQNAGQLTGFVMKKFLDETMITRKEPKITADGEQKPDEQPLGKVIAEYVEKGAIEADWADNVKTPMEAIQLLEGKAVENRFVPPRIWLDEVDREDTSFVYVGTVLNCEMLADATNQGGKPCDADVQRGSNKYEEGGADTGSYVHYKIKDKGQRTHRRIAATGGPLRFGNGTKVQVRVTSGYAGDLVVLFSVPTFFDSYSASHGGKEQLKMSLSEFDKFCNEQNPVDTCIPEEAIALRLFDDSGERIEGFKAVDPRMGDITDDLKADSKLVNVALTFDLMSYCSIDENDENYLVCPTAMQTVSDGETKVRFAEDKVLRVARKCRERGEECPAETVGNAFFVATVVDMGNVDERFNPPNEFPSSDRDQACYLPVPLGQQIFGSAAAKAFRDGGVATPVSIEGGAEELRVSCCVECFGGGAHFNYWKGFIYNE